jgi:NADH-quinone oxidoreductase subunit L
VADHAAGITIDHGGSGATTELVLMLAAVLVAIGGIAAARRFYARPSGLPDRAARAAGPIYPLVANRYWVDELYDATVLRAYYALAALFDAFDRWAVDGLVNALAAFTELVGQALRLLQTGFVRHYALFVFVGAVIFVWALS